MYELFQLFRKPWDEMSWLERAFLIKRLKGGGGWISDYETEPYHYRPCPDLGHDYNREYDTIVGASVAWNQLFDFSENSTRWKSNGSVTRTWNNGVLTVSNGSTDNAYAYQELNAVSGHKYLAHLKANTVQGEGVTSEGAFACYISGGTINWTFSIPAAGRTVDYIFNGSTETTRMQLRPNKTTNSLVANELYFIDLTLALGSTIADYVYSLEQGTAGAGVAFLKKYFPCLDSYNQFDSGSMQSVIGLVSHDMVGFNQWDGTYEANKWLASVDGTVSNQDGYNVTDYVRVIPNTEYYIPSTGSGRTLFYDADKNTLPNQSWNQVGNLFTTPQNAHYMRFTITNAKLSEFCLSFHSDRDGQYEQYSKHSYPLDSTVTLRGKFSLVDGKLVADGDVYPSSGEGTTNYGEVDLGTLDWTYQSGTTRFFSEGLRSVIKAVSSSSEVPKLVCSKYMTESLDSMGITGHDKSVALSTTKNVYLKDTAYSDPTALKNSLNGVKLVYPLATPTTFSATPYDNPQICDPSGTEEYVSTSIVPIGHNTKYAQ